jgi:hypothetical protein
MVEYPTGTFRSLITQIGYGTYTTIPLLSPAHRQPWHANIQTRPSPLSLLRYHARPWAAPALHLTLSSFLNNLNLTSKTQQTNLLCQSYSWWCCARSNDVAGFSVRLASNWRFLCVLCYSRAIFTCMYILYECELPFMGRVHVTLGYPLSFHLFIILQIPQVFWFRVTPRSLLPMLNY